MAAFSTAILQRRCLRQERVPHGRGAGSGTSALCHRRRHSFAGTLSTALRSQCSWHHEFWRAAKRLGDLRLYIQSGCRIARHEASAASASSRAVCQERRRSLVTTSLFSPVRVVETAPTNPQRANVCHAIILSIACRRVRLRQVLDQRH